VLRRGRKGEDSQKEDDLVRRFLKIMDVEKT